MLHISSYRKEWYAGELQLANGLDPYKTTREEWEDHIDVLPTITCVHILVLLILYASHYTQEDMLNYNSLGSVKQFQNGWLREVSAKISVDSHHAAVEE